MRNFNDCKKKITKSFEKFKTDLGEYCEKYKKLEPEYLGDLSQSFNETIKLEFPLDSNIESWVNTQDYIDSAMRYVLNNVVKYVQIDTSGLIYLKKLEESRDAINYTFRDMLAINHYDVSKLRIK